MNSRVKKSSNDARACLDGLVTDCQMDCRSVRMSRTSASIGVLDVLSRITNSSVVFFGLNILSITWKIVFRRGLPEAFSRPMSWHHMLTSRVSAVAIAKSEDCFSNLVSSSPRSRPSVPSRSMINVGPYALSFGDLASQTPLVVCDLPRDSSII